MFFTKLIFLHLEISFGLGYDISVIRGRECFFVEWGRQEGKQHSAHLWVHHHQIRTEKSPVYAGALQLNQDIRCITPATWWVDAVKWLYAKILLLHWQLFFSRDVKIVWMGIICTFLPFMPPPPMPNKLAHLQLVCHTMFLPLYISAATPLYTTFTTLQFQWL